MSNILNAITIDSIILGFLSNKPEVAKWYTDVKTQRDFPVIEFCKKLGISLFLLPEEYESKYSGLLTKKGDIFSIFLNRQDGKFRQKFTIAHELGHIIYNHKFDYNLDSNNEKPIEFLPWGAEYLLRISDYSKQEQEANDFAANLLLRETLLKQDIELFTKDNSSKNPIEVVLQEEYQVSFTFLRYRLDNLNIKIPKIESLLCP